MTIKQIQERFKRKQINNKRNRNKNRKREKLSLVGLAINKWR